MCLSLFPSHHLAQGEARHHWAVDCGRARDVDIVRWPPPHDVPMVSQLAILHHVHDVVAFGSCEYLLASWHGVFFLAVRADAHLHVALQDVAQYALLKGAQFPCRVLPQTPRLAPIQQLCGDDGLEDPHFRSHTDFTGVEKPTLQVVEGGGRDPDPFSHCRVVTTTFGHHAPKVLKLRDTLDGCAVNVE